MAATARNIAKIPMAEAQEWLSRLPENVSEAYDAVSDAYDSTRRSLKRGIKSAQEFTDEARYQIKRHPFKTAAISLGVGVGLGLLVGWSVNHRRRSWLFG